MISCSHWGMYRVKVSDYFYFDGKRWFTDGDLPYSWDFDE